MYQYSHKSIQSFTYFISVFQYIIEICFLHKIMIFYLSLLQQINDFIR